MNEQEFRTGTAEQEVAAQNAQAAEANPTQAGETTTESPASPASTSDATTETEAQQLSAEPIRQEAATHKVRELTRLENEMMALLASFDDKAKGVLANASDELKIAAEKIREAGEAARRHLFGS